MDRATPTETGDCPNVVPAVQQNQALHAIGRLCGDTRKLWAMLCPHEREGALARRELNAKFERAMNGTG